MRKILIVSVGALAIGLSACGGHSKALQSAQSNPQAQRDVAKAEAIYKRCVPDPFMLRSKIKRQRAVACAVPPKNRLPFERCLTTGILNGHIPTKGRIESVTLTCIGRYA